MTKFIKYLWIPFISFLQAFKQVHEFKKDMAEIIGIWNEGCSKSRENNK